LPVSNPEPRDYDSAMFTCRPPPPKEYRNELINLLLEGCLVSIVSKTLAPKSGTSEATNSLVHQPSYVCNSIAEYSTFQKTWERNIFG